MSVNVFSSVFIEPVGFLAPYHLEITWFALAAGTILLIWAFGAITWLARWARGERGRASTLAADLRAVAQDEGPALRHGLSGAGLDRVRAAFDRDAMGQTAWSRIQGAVVVRRDPEEAERYWLSADNPGMLSDA